MSTGDGLRIAQEITLGRADDQIAEVIKAVMARQMDGAAVVCWQIDLPALDLTVTEDDFTVGETRAIERETGFTWDQIAPARSASMFSAVVTAALVKRKGMTEDDARAAVDDLPASAAVSSVTFYDGLPAAPPTAPDA